MYNLNVFYDQMEFFKNFNNNSLLQLKAQLGQQGIVIYNYVQNLKFNFPNIANVLEYNTNGLDYYFNFASQNINNIQNEIDKHNICLNKYVDKFPNCYNFNENTIKDFEGKRYYLENQMKNIFPFADKNLEIIQNLHPNVINDYSKNESNLNHKSIEIDKKKTSDSLLTNSNIFKKVTNKEKKFKEKKFECKYDGCKKKFEYKWILNRHLNSHFCFRLFKCDSCSKAYKSKENLDLHFKNKHKGFKPYICDFCESRFSHRNGIFIFLINYFIFYFK